MPYMKPLPKFEPGQTTKVLLSFVKKTERIGQTPLPGLFQDRLFDVVMCFAIIAFVLECVGLWFITDAYGLGFWNGVMSIGFLVLLDIFFAFLYHLRTRTISLAKNSIVVLGLDTNLAAKASTQADNEHKIFWARLWSFGAAILIWGMAALKTAFFLSFQSLGGGGFNTTTLFILVTYLIVALIHVYCTGYAVFGLLARVRWWWDERRYVRVNDPHANKYHAKEYQEVIITRCQMPTRATAANGRHTLEKLLSVDLIFRDEQNKARVVLGQSIQSELMAAITTRLHREYMKEKAVEESALAPYQNEIKIKARQHIDEIVKVDIDPVTIHGILHPDLKNLLTFIYALSGAQIDLLGQGYALCLLKADGLLLDEEVVELVRYTSDPHSTTEIALRGLRLQLQQMPA